MKAAVITFPGSNCDDDLVFALSKVGVPIETVKLWHKDETDLSSFSLVALPGGFSYGDYLRCGAIAALSPIMQQVKAFAKKGGYVIGTCNGFQMLCELGLLPGALAKNESLSFVCKDVSMKVISSDSPWTRELKEGESISLPIAHGDGRYIIAEDEYQAMLKEGQILLQYEAQDGKESPNGSVHAIAGVCNREKNVFGLMPHPERATDLRSRDGLKIWKSVVTSLARKTA